MRPGYRASIDCSIKSIKVTVAKLSTAQPHYAEGRSHDGNPRTKPTVLALRCLNKASNEGQAGEDLENEPGQEKDALSKERNNPLKMEFRAHSTNPPQSHHCVSLLGLGLPTGMGSQQRS